MRVLRFDNRIYCIDKLIYAVTLENEFILTFVDNNVLHVKLISDRHYLSKVLYEYLFYSDADVSFNTEDWEEVL